MKKPLDILKQYWGYPNFRPAQEAIIQSVLDGRDTLALLPTGGGKSVCYQVPALCKEGICIVVSPLIALMKDQVYQLKRRDIPAVAIYSGMRYADIDRTLDNCIYGKIKLLYLSPERLMTELARERIAKMNVNLLAIDEAHCISQWGYDFRPPYLQIAELRDLLPDTPILALTATATTEVEKDIQEKLVFKDQQVFKTSFARDNLVYVVLRDEHKLNKLLDIVQKVKGSGVVYVRNRRKTKEIALFLQKKGISADFYHAGLPAEARSRKQDAWINDKIRIIVSTNAFGMGIDKPDVRSVVHMDLPDSLEAYFQEAGRGGRDGKKSFAVLLYSEADKKRLETNYEQAFPEMETIRQVYRALGSHFQLAVGGGANQTYDFDIVDFTKKYSFNIVETFNALKILEQAECIALSEAIYLPSQLQIKVGKDQLYDYQMRNARFDPILKTILRTYQGAFHGFIKIREKQLAEKLKMSRHNLSTALEKMQQDKVIDYLPQKDMPQLVFLHERVDADNLAIDHKRQKFLKTRHYERIKKAIAYAEKEQCRHQLLLEYFDEKDALPCGKCDFCLERRKASVSKDEYASYATKIERLLRKEQLDLHELVDSFTPKRRNQVLKVIDFLLDEGKIDKKDGFLIWKG